MSRRVFLHVGLPKSGTSYLQKVLSANRLRLREEARVLFPGASWSDQVLAVRDVRGLYDARLRNRVEGRWEAMAEEVQRWRGDAVISMEWLCAAREQQIERIVGSFGRREVHVVFTARDLARTLPAAWQEFVQNRQTWTWQEFLAGVRDPETTSTGGKAFWSQQDLPGLLDRWSAQVGPERVALVTLPQPGADRDLLWRRFCEVLGIDPVGYVTEGLGGNESLGLESAELMRRVNLHLRESANPRRAWRGYNPVFKHLLAKEVLASRRDQESTLTLPLEAHDWVVTRAEEHLRAVSTRPVRVVGDLADLRPVLAGQPEAESVQPGELSDAALLDTAVAALVGLARASRHPRSSTTRRTPASPPPRPLWRRVASRVRARLRRR